jgi:hypothetical protein
MIPLSLKVIDRLGSGAFGEVWSAEDENKRLFAVKFFGGATSDASQRSALAHANALIRVRHPGVVRVHAITPVEHPDAGIQLALVMEYITGTTLNKLHEPISTERAMAAIHMIAGGLQAIHDEGLVHGDLHSGNVFITPSGARLIDLFHAYTQAGEEPAKRSATRLQDTKDFASIAEGISRLVPDFSELQIAQTLEVARAQHVDSPALVAQAFSTLAPMAFNVASSVAEAATQPRRPLPHDAETFFLLISKLDRWGVSHITRVVAHGRTIGAYSGVLLATRSDLFRLRHCTREVELLGEDYAVEMGDEPPDSAYKLTPIRDAVLEGCETGVTLPVASSDPSPRSRPGLWQLSRLIGIQGLIGQYLFIEQSDWQYAGGAHPDVTCRFSVLDIERGIHLHHVHAEQERHTAIAREGRIAAETFRALRDDELLQISDEIEIYLSSVCPAVRFDRLVKVGVNLVFSTYAAFVNSDNRWSSYTISEEVPAKGLPAMLSEFSEVPLELLEPLQAAPGTVVGFSSINRSHKAFRQLERILAE